MIHSAFKRFISKETKIWYFDSYSMNKIIGGMSPVFGSRSPAKNRRRRDAAAIAYAPKTPPTLPLDHVQAARNSCEGDPPSLRPKPPLQKVAKITRTPEGSACQKKCSDRFPKKKNPDRSRLA